MIKLLMTLTVLLNLTITTPAFAEHDGTQCLQTVSSDALLQEVRRRMVFSNAHTDETAIFSTSCDTALNLTLTTIDTKDIETNVSIYVGNRFTCKKYKEQIFAKVGNTVYDRVIVALCDVHNTLFKISIRPTGSVTQISETYIGNVNRCAKQATTFNLP